jgi:hypothetical protein
MGGLVRNSIFRLSACMFLMLCTVLYRDDYWPARSLQEEPEAIVESGPSCCLQGDRLVRPRSNMDLSRVIWGSRQL